MRIGVDLGGTKIEAVAIDENGVEKYRRRVPTPQGDYTRTLEAIAGLVRDIETKLDIRDLPVGVGTPGALSPATGLIKNSNSTVLNGKPLDKDLQSLLKRPVRLANDANCFVLSEAADGAAAGAGVVFGVILGTGVGGGVVVGGKIIVGVNAIAGEWGHNPLPWPKADELPGPLCSCGKSGCIESFLCGPALARDHKNGNGVNAQDVARLAESGDPDAENTLRRYEDRLARALASVINVLDPDVVVLGGGVSNVERLYENVPRLWGRFIFTDQVGTKLVPAKHGDSGGVRGAAWLF